MKRFLLFALALGIAFGGSAQKSSKLTAETRALLHEYKTEKVQNGRTVKSTVGKLPSAASRLKVAAPQAVDGVQALQVWVKFADNNYSGLRAISGVKIVAEFDGLVGALVPMNALEKVAALRNVTEVAVSSVAEPESYDARLNTNVDDILNFSNDAKNAGLDKAYDGTGVIIGVIDQGIMYNHTAFQNASGTSRVKMVLQYNSETSTIDEYRDASAIAALTTNSTTTTHGTHVSSLAAGKTWTFNKYYYNQQSGSVVTTGGRVYGGMAPNADLVLCDLGSSGGSTNLNIAAAVQKIFDYAEEEGKPCVINISLGSQTGGRDGSDGFAQVIAAYRNQPGRIICCSSGNYGNTNKCYNNIKTSQANPGAVVFSYCGTYGNGYTSGSTTMNNLILNGSANTYARTPNVELACRIMVVQPSSNKLVWISDEITDDVTYTVNQNEKDDSSYAWDDTFAECFEEMADGAGHFFVRFHQDAYTGKHYISSEAYFLRSLIYTSSGSTYTGTVYIGLLVYPKTSSETVTLDTFGSVSSNSKTETIAGSVTVDLDIVNFTASSTDCSVGNLCTSPDVIAVGAYNNTLKWTSNNQTTTSTTFTSVQGTLLDPAPTSSYAVADNPAGRALPDIMAPGRQVFGAYNSYATAPGTSYQMRDWSNFADNAKYYFNGGTSMASPCATGICALLLQINPELTLSKMRQILTSTAISDSHTTTAQSGAYGRVDALAAAVAVLNLEPGIRVSTNSISVVTKKTENVTETFTVSSNDLSDDITVSLIDPDGAFEIDKTTLSYTETEAGNVTVTVTFKPGSTEGAHKALVRLSSPGVNPVDVELSGEYSTASAYWDPCAKYFDMSCYESITDETYPKARTNASFTTLTKFCVATTGASDTWVTFTPAGMARAKVDDGCQWVAYSAFATTTLNWTASSPCLGRASYYSGTSGRVMNATAERTEDFCVTSVTGVAARCYATVAGKTLKLEAYECTVSADGTPTAAASAAKSTSATTVKSTYSDLKLDGLDVSKVYLIRVTYTYQFCEIGFKVPNSAIGGGGGSTSDAKIATSIASSVINIKIDQNEESNTSFYVSGTDLTGDITLSLEDPDNVFTLDRTLVTVAEAEKTASAVKVPFVATKAAEDGQEVILSVDTSSAGTHTGRIVLTSDGAVPAAIDITAVVDPVTGIVDIIAEPADENGTWYTLQGLRLNAKPVQKGVYIHNGRKVLVK